MGGGPEIRLGDLVEIHHGFPFDSSFFSDDPTDSILLTPANFKPGGGFDDSRLKYYGADLDSIPSQYILNPHDIIIALTDLSRESSILGCGGRVPTMNPISQKILHNQRIGRVVLLPGNMEKINMDFLYWLLRSVDYRSYIISTASGSTVKHTSPKQIENFRFLLPPLKEQISAAVLLNAVETKINILENFDVILENAALSCFQWFFPDSRKDAQRPLADFGKIICGRTPTKEVNRYFGGPVPFIKIPELRHNIYIIRTVDSLSFEGAATQPNKQLPPNSICVSCIATVGLIAFTAAWCHTNQQINSIIPHNHWYRYYLYCYLKKLRPQLEALSTGGSTTLNLSTGRFSQLPIPQPPQSLLEDFYWTVHPFFHRILLNTHHVERLINFRDTLLPGLLTGKIKFPESFKIK